MSRSLYKNRDLEKLEPYEGKLSCTVLRGEEGSNALDLPDQTVERYTGAHALQVVDALLAGRNVGGRVVAVPDADGVLLAVAIFIIGCLTVLEIDGKCACRVAVDAERAVGERKIRSIWIAIGLKEPVIDARILIAYYPIIILPLGFLLRQIDVFAYVPIGVVLKHDIGIPVLREVEKEVEYTRLVLSVLCAQYWFLHAIDDDGVGGLLHWFYHHLPFAYTAAQHHRVVLDGCARWFGGGAVLQLDFLEVADRVFRAIALCFDGGAMSCMQDMAASSKSKYNKRVSLAERYRRSRSVARGCLHRSARKKKQPAIQIKKGRPKSPQD